MKVGLFTSGYQRNPLEHAFEDAKRFGYDYVELWGGRPHAYAPDLKNGDIKLLRDLIDKYEMPVLGYTPEMNAYPYNVMLGTEAMRKDSIEYTKLCMDMAKEMGAEFTLVSLAHAGYLATGEEIWDRALLCMQELTAHAEKLQHTLILEALTPYESNVCVSANEVIKVFKAVPSPYLVGMCDIVAPFVQHESILAYFNKLGDKMRHMHIIDSDGTSETHVMPCEGVIPLKELIQEIKELGYKRSATLELVTAYMNEPRLAARKAINNFRSLL